MLDNGSGLSRTERSNAQALTALLQAASSDTVTVLFSVRDTGIGVDASKQELIFEQFAQEDSTTTRHYGGTGLGLSVSRHLARRMGGDLLYEPTPQRVRFTWLIPV